MIYWSIGSSIAGRLPIFPCICPTQTITICQGNIIRVSSKDDQFLDKDHRIVHNKLGGFVVAEEREKSRRLTPAYIIEKQ